MQTGEFRLRYLFVFLIAIIIEIMPTDIPMKIDIVNINAVSDRTLIGYVDEATNEKDRLYDAVTSVGTSMKIYTLLENDRMTIQGRVLPFDEGDSVNLGINIPSEGTYTIAIAAIDGLFLGQDIFLKDNNQAITHNIKEAPYVFSSVSGTFDDRFKLILSETFTIELVLMEV